jgi:hypothetical protein
MHMTRPTTLLLLAGLSACASGPSPQQTQHTTAPGNRAFSAPQGIAAHSRWIAVASSAFEHVGGKGQWGEGFVTLIDRETRQVVSRVPTTQPNPRDIVVVGDLAYVVNSGTFALDEDGLATVTRDGGIDIIDLGTASPPRAMAANLRLPQHADDPRIGAYGSIAVSPDGRWAAVGSGTRGDVFLLDLSSQQIVRGPDHPIVLFPTPPGQNGMTTVRRVGDRLAVLDFNGDSLCVSDDWEGQLARRTCQGIGANDEFLEGPVDVAANEVGDLLVLMTIANSVYRVDGGQTPFTVHPDYFSTGLANNRILLLDNFGYVVNSTSNNLQRLHLDDGAWDLPFAAFAPGANPFDMVITNEPTRRVAWVTLFADHQIAVVALESGQVLDLIGPELGDLSGPQVPSPLRPADGCAVDPSTDLVTVQEVMSVRYGVGAGHGQSAMPAVVQGGPHGAGRRAGSTSDVLSLGRGGEIVVGFGDYDVVDGPGPDLIVFENAFEAAPYSPYAEPAFVGLSATGTADANFIDFPCDPSQAQGDPQRHVWPHAGCAGVRPVEANMLTNCVSPVDPQTAGGDAFDLADLGLQRARYLRIRDAEVSSCAKPTCGFDLDAVVLIHAERRAP